VRRVSAGSVRTAAEVQEGRQRRWCAEEGAKTYSEEWCESMRERGAVRVQGGRRAASTGGVRAERRACCKKSENPAMCVQSAHAEREV